MAVLFVTLLAASTGAVFFDVTVTAHSPPWIFTTNAYISANPNPVGVGQQALIYVWLDYTIQGNMIDNTIRFRNYQLTITHPDGQTETKTWPIVTDTTASAYTPFTPTVAGEY